MRGGRGNAGTTTHRYIQVVKIEKATGKKIIGKYGFKRPQKMIKEVDTMNVSHLDQSIDTLVEDGFAQKEGKSYTINLAEMGIDKLLAQGNVNRAINVTVEKASERAVSKIEKAGGSITLLEN
jgi:large subunit ribosomal protein L15